MSIWNMILWPFAIALKIIWTALKYALRILGEAFGYFFT